MPIGYSTIKIFKKYFFFLIILVQVSFAQGSGTIKGIVYDKITNDGLPGANIIVKGTNLGAATDLDGKFTIRNVPAGKQILVASYIGYIPFSLEAVVTANKTLEQNFTLQPEALEGQTVVVTAQAQGQLEAINQQLTSDKISNVVSEARIQELPDFNAAAAISRLPGISTTQSSGEDNKVVIRGLSPKYNSVEVEGIRLAATGSSSIGLVSDTYVSTGGIQNDRSVDLTMISPYMIRMISVYKSLTPDMNANSIGGTVNMELREAPSNLHYDLLWQQGYTAKSNTYGNFRTVGSISDRFFDGKLGVYALINAESYDRNADNLTAGYNLAGEAVTIDPETGFRPVKVSSVTFNRHIETRKRYGGNLILDYSLPEGSIKFVNMFTRINGNYTDYNQTINYDNGVMSWQLRNGENITDQELHSLKFNYDLGFINADLSASYNIAKNNLDKSPVFSFNQTDALQSGTPRDNKTPEELTYLLTNYKGDSAVVLRSGNLYSNFYKEEKFTYKADFQVPYNLDAISGYLKFGGQFDKKTISTDQEAPYLGFNGSVTSTNTDIQTNLLKALQSAFGISVDKQGNLIGPYFKNSDSKLFDSFLGNQFGSVYYAANPGLMNDILNYIIGRPEFNASNKDFSTGSVGGWYDGPYQQLVNDYNYKENYYATYAMAKVNFLDFMLIGGARYEKVTSNYFAYNARDNRNPQSQIMYDTTSVKENEFFLPMAQMKYSPLNWLDIRYAYTQTLARPDYQQLSPKFTITQSNQIFTGNPELKPARAFNHDVNITVHNNELGLFTIGGFYKTLKDFVYSASYRLDAAEGAGIDALYRYQIVRNGQYVVSPVLTNGKSDATVFRPLNNPFDATVKGVELDFQHNFWYLPEPFNHIVFGINYTRIYSDTRYPWYDVKVKVVGRDRIAVLIDSSSTGRLIDQPNHVLNSYIGYDYEGFSCRLSVLYQSNAATGNGGRYSENDSYTKDYFRTDFSARQKLPWYNIEAFLDVSNLNNANTRGIERAISGFTNIQNYGLTANLGLRMRF
jgi:TonB-dependent receptor